LCEVPVIFGYQSNLNLLDRFFKNPHISSFVIICPVGAELFHAGRHDKAKSCFSQFCEMQELEILNDFITDQLIISVGDKTS